MLPLATHPLTCRHRMCTFVLSLHPGDMVFLITFYSVKTSKTCTVTRCEIWVRFGLSRLLVDSFSVLCCLAPTPEYSSRNSVGLCACHTPQLGVLSSPHTQEISIVCASVCQVVRADNHSYCSESPCWILFWVMAFDAEKLFTVSDCTEAAGIYIIYIYAIHMHQESFIAFKHFSSLFVFCFFCFQNYKGNKLRKK